MNILLVHSDQHRLDAMRHSGNRHIQTPALDRLAAEGTRFTHAFTPVPICSAARASLLTGSWPTTHGCLSIPNCESFRNARRELPVLTELLKGAGYWLGWVGKYHDELEGYPKDHGVDEFVPYDAYNKWRESQGIPPKPSRNGFFGEPDMECPPDKSSLAWQADNIIRMMESAAAAGTPFMLRWDPPQPHLPAMPTKAYLDLYADVPIPPWPSFPDTLEGKPSPQARQHDIWGTRGWTWDRWLPFVRCYYGIVSEMDANLARILARLDALGLRDNTLVIYSTDHGDFYGGHGLIDKHYSMYDDIVRVPLIVRWPGRSRPGTACDAFVSNELDIARTILDAADVPAPASFAGMNLVDLANGTGAAPREDIFIQYFGTQSGMYSSRAIRDWRFKYVFNPLHGDELYDIVSDPGELRNRVGEPALAGELARMRARLVAWMKQVKDPLYNQWTAVHLEGAPNQAQRMQSDF